MENGQISQNHYLNSFFQIKKKFNFSGTDTLSLWWMFYQSNSKTLFWVKPCQEKVLKGVKTFPNLTWHLLFQKTITVFPRSANDYLWHHDKFQLVGWFTSSLILLDEKYQGHLPVNIIIVLIINILRYNRMKLSTHGVKWMFQQKQQKIQRDVLRFATWIGTE